MKGSPPVLAVTFGLLLAACAPPRAEAQRSIVLPEPDREGAKPVETALEARRSVREFARTSVSLQSIGQLAWAAQGVTSRDGLRTAPSAGALYPLEVLVVASRVEGLASGVYRYVPDTHALALINEGSNDLGAKVARAALGQEWIEDAAAVFVIAAVESRTERKYGSRAERYVHIEAGCAAENLLLQAVALDLGTTAVGAFDDAAVSALLGLERGEAPVLLIPVGEAR
jgi:SagB-type dehydrogenase family enzyme